MSDTNDTNFSPSKDVETIVSTLNKPESDVVVAPATPTGVDTPVTERKKRGRPRKVPASVRSSGTTKTTKSKRITKKHKTKKITKVPVEAAQKRRLPRVISNLLIFTVMFAILIAVHMIIRITEDRRNTELNVTPAVVTSEDEVAMEDAKAIEKTKQTAQIEQQQSVGTEAEIKTETKAETETKVEASAVVDEAKPAEQAVQPAEETVKTEEPKVVEPKPIKKVASVNKKKFSKVKKDIYSGGPYNNGGALDLDGPSARQGYLESNRVKVQQEAKRENY